MGYTSRAISKEATSMRRVPYHVQTTSVDPNYLLKHAIWAYFLLLIFEGALRKWFLPGLATPLLVIRDPIALWLVFQAWKRGLLPSNPFLVTMLIVGVTGIFTATLFGHGSIPVALFGARILLFHFPLIFVIGRIFNRDDVIRLGKLLLWIAIPMTLLIALQFYSPQSAWVNRGVGGSIEGAGFSGSGGFMRPPATFSFTNGTTLFYGLVAVFVFYFWLKSEQVNKVLLLAATLGLLTAIPLTISRGLFFQVVLTMAFAAAANIRKPKYLLQTTMAIVALIIGFLVLSQLGFFNTAIEAFTSRFESANENEGGLEGVFIDRFLGGMVGALSESTDLPFFGHGIGMGTNVGSMLLTGGTAFLISEGEWGRLIGELGPIMGLAVILVRLGFCVKIAIAAYNKMVVSDLLPWLLLSFGFLTVLQAQWAQPTALGFSTLVAGLMIASLRGTKE